MSDLRRLFLAFAVVLAFVLLSVADADGLRLGEACGLDRAQSGSVKHHMTGYTAVLSASELAAIADWSGEEIAWLDDGAGYGYFDAPTFKQWPVEYAFVLDDGAARFVFVWSDGATWWVYGFNSLAVTEDRNGAHSGLHDFCAYFEMTT